MKVKYVTGDATKPLGSGEKIIVHVCNNQGGWGAGFVLALSKKWKLPEQKYREWAKKDDFTLGKTQFVGCGGSITVANMVAQDGFGGVAIKYNKLRECLAQVYEKAKELGATVHGPRFGAGLAGGSWCEIEPIIEDELTKKGVEVTIYDFAG
jgi:O-acetyl-ADP-ribose deacetylase (regulator of RNase III)